MLRGLTQKVLSRWNVSAIFILAIWLDFIWLGVFFSYYLSKAASNDDLMIKQHSKSTAM
jgi:hypothetical protein